MLAKFNSSIKKQGFYQALGVSAYCFLVGLIFLYGEAIFGRMANLVGPVAFLILFIVSALICALIVFYKHYQLFFEGKRKEAADLVLATTAWLFVAFCLFLLLSTLMRKG
jgi:MFS family permease